jgi:hypothetical protein
MFDLPLAIINTIIDAGLATAKDTDIFKLVSPSTPDQFIVVREYAGIPDPWPSIMGLRSIQIEVRSRSNIQGMQLINNLFELLRPTSNFSDFGGEPCIVGIRTSPSKIGTDSSHRYIFSFNMGIRTKL